MGGAKGIWELCTPSPFFCKPSTALKQNLLTIKPVERGPWCSEDAQGWLAVLSPPSAERMSCLVFDPVMHAGVPSFFLGGGTKHAGFSSLTLGEMYASMRCSPLFLE